MEQVCVPSLSHFELLSFFVHPSFLLSFFFFTAKASLTSAISVVPLI
jgi:hypothetical protein